MAAEFPPASFDEVPIIFISTHGVYDLTIEPEPFVVPENVYIFETQTIGDVCMTPLDKPLWNLMSNRPEFLEYFKGVGNYDDAKAAARTAVYDDANEDSDTVGDKHRDYKKVFRNMHFYQPGDTIYNRTLSIGGGGDGARRDYANMGFYRFDVGAPIDRYPDGPANKIRPLQPLRTAMIADENMRTTQREIIDEIGAIYPETAEGVIYIFSSCAAFWKEDDGVKTPAATLNRRMRLIESAQQAQDLALMGLTTAGPGGAGANNNTGDLPATGRNIHTRAAKKGSAAFAPAPSSEEGDEAFFENDNADFANRDPRLTGPEGEEDEAYAEVDEAAAKRAETIAAAVGKKSVFIKVANGHYRQIPTPLTDRSAKPDLLFSARDIRDAKKAHGEVYGFNLATQQFHLLGGGRRVSRKAVPRRRRQTRRRF